MKRYLFLTLAVALALTGCTSAQATDPFKVDTVVMIPEKPTALPTEEVTEPPTEAQEEQTEAPTERPVTALVVPEATKPKQTASSNKTSGKTSNKTSSGNTQKPKATEPPVTEQPAINTPPIEAVPPVEMPTEPSFDPASYNIGNLEYATLDALNVYRLATGTEVLSIDRKLCGIAFLRAQEVVAYWGHMRPDGRGYISALSDYGYPHGDAAELLVYVTGNGDPAAIASMWMNAETQRAMILNGGFSAAGIGVYQADGMSYVVCLLVG